MVSTSFALSASTTRWYPSVSSAGTSAVAAVSSGEGAAMVRGPPWAGHAVRLLVSPSAARPPTSKTYRRPAHKQRLSAQAAVASSTLDRHPLSAVHQRVLDARGAPRPVSLGRRLTRPGSTDLARQTWLDGT